MARIQNFPQGLINEHSRWHMQHMGRARSGDGVDFLSFHRFFLQEALDWYNAQGLNPSLVEPWSSIPSEIKNHPRWTEELEDAEYRIVNNLSSFRSSDELGRFLLASFLHDAVHIIGSEVFNDSDFGRISLSPRSTLFYNWHGLIDNWWRQLENLRSGR